MMMSKLKSTILAAMAAVLLAPAGAALAQEPPAAGESPRIDAIRKAGALRVGVLANPPWLWENTMGEGEKWEGPVWTLVNEAAKLLDVRLDPIPVSNDTKVPVLAANQVDITIAPLAETAERLEVVDFILYSATSICMFGLKSNPLVAAAETLDDLDKPEVTISFLVGTNSEDYLKNRYPNATLRGQISSNTVPVDEILAGRGDFAIVNRVQWVSLSKKVPGLSVLPKENECQDSQENAQPVGAAITKGQDVFLGWLRAVAERLHGPMRAEEMRIISEKM
jgi:polar amino acid transport system substrate-binding protein